VSLGRGRDGGAQCRDVGDIGLQGQGPVARFGGDGIGTGGAVKNIRKGDARALGGETLDQCGTYAGGAAGHEDRGVLEVGKYGGGHG
jgi:hypothetical protein